jgi:DNA-binding NarL/FixJ family response regulator
MAKAGFIRVLLADDHAMVRQGLRSALQAYLNIEVVGEAGDGDEAVAVASKLQPTIVVMDINMSKMDGITATRLIKLQHPHIVVIGLTADLKDYQVYAMQKAGAFAVLSKYKAVNELYGAIQRAIASIQPILILEDTPASAESHAQLENSENLNPKDMSSVEESKEATERKSSSEK